MACYYTYNLTLGSATKVFPAIQPKKTKRMFDALEKRSRTVESDRNQRSKSEGYRLLYVEKWYLINNFPRLCYHHQLVRSLTNQMRSLGLPSQIYELKDVKRVQLYLAGDINEETENLITSSKEGPVRCSWKSKPQWPVSALIYFQSEEESLSRIEELVDSIRPAAWTKIFIVLNQRTRPSKIAAESKYQILYRRKRSVREALNSFLETPLKECIQKFLEEFNGDEGSIKSEEMPEILNECKSVLTQMSPNRNEIQIPEPIKNFLFQRPDVHGFGIWETSEFRVFIGNSAGIDPLKSELCKLSPEFCKNMSIHIVSGEIKMHSYIKQGDKVYLDMNGENVQPSYATAGALLKDSQGSDEVYGLTCHHVLTQEKIAVYVTSPETSKPSKVGKCIYSNTEPFHDFAVFQIDEDEQRNCDTTFLNRMEDPCNVDIHEGLITPNAVVHKKGATTNLTDGRITCSEFYSKLFGNRNEMFLVSNFSSRDHPFSAKGDSGSVVFQHDRSPDQKSVFALGLVTGGINDVRDEGLTEVLNSTVCLRLNKALSRLSEKKQLNLEFENSRRMSSSSEESV